MSPEGDGSLNRVLFSTELAFLNILIPRLPQNTSDVNAECAGKPKQLYSYCDEPLGAVIYVYFIFLILISF